MSSSSQKFIEVIKYVINYTKRSKLDWKILEDENSQSYFVEINNSRIIITDTGLNIRITIDNKENNVQLGSANLSMFSDKTLNGLTYIDFKELYEAARSNALNIDGGLDDLLGKLKSME